MDLFLGNFDLPAVFIRLGDAQAKGYIFKYIQMGKQRVLLEYGVDRPLIGRNVIDPHPVKQNIPRGGRLKTTDDAKGGRLAAAAGA